MLINLDRTRNVLKEENLDAVLLVTPINVIYASDSATEFMLGRFEDFTTAVLIAADPEVPTALIVPEFDLPYLMERPSWIEDICVYGNPWSSVGIFMGQTLEDHLDTELRIKLKAIRAKTHTKQKANIQEAVLKALNNRGLKTARLGCDDLRFAKQMEDLGATGNSGFTDVLQPMRRIRMVKTESEIGILTEGAKINSDALNKVIAAGHAGINEGDLTAVYRRELTENNARYLGERGMMFGAGDASTFSLPATDDRALTMGSAVVLDCLGTYQSYHMDLARTAVVGAPTKDQIQRYEATRLALEEVEAGMKPGVHTQHLRELVGDTIEKCGLQRELVSVTTHGLGLEVFEFPNTDGLPNGFVLERDMIVNTEVFYRDPGLGAFHLEDSVRVTENGCSFLHPMTRDLVVFT